MDDSKLVGGWLCGGFYRERMSPEETDAYFNGSDVEREAAVLAVGVRALQMSAANRGVPVVAHTRWAPGDSGEVVCVVRSEWHGRAKPDRRRYLSGLDLLRVLSG